MRSKGREEEIHTFVKFRLKNPFCGNGRQSKKKGQEGGWKNAQTIKITTEKNVRSKAQIKECEQNKSEKTERLQRNCVSAETAGAREVWLLWLCFEWSII